VEKEDDLSELIGRRIMVSKLVGRVVDRMGEGETFGAARVAAEVNRRYREHLRRAVSARAVSVTLRRLRDAGSLHGEPHAQLWLLRALPPTGAPNSDCWSPLQGALSTSPGIDARAGARLADD
jgi:hypothetical protein